MTATVPADIADPPREVQSKRQASWLLTPLAIVLGSRAAVAAGGNGLGGLGTTAPSGGCGG